MKKLVLGMMLLAGVAAYGNNTNTAEATGTVNLSAYAAGDLKMVVSGDLDFGNLRSYASTTTQTATFTLADTNLREGATTTAAIDYKISPLTGNGHTVTVNHTSPVTSVDVNKAGVTNNLVLSLDQAQANAAPAGDYTGSVTITATYDI